AKKVLGWFSAVHSMVCRPLSLQVFARSSKKPAEKVRREPAGLPGKPEGSPDTPLGHGFLTTRHSRPFMLFTLRSMLWPIATRSSASHVYTQSTRKQIIMLQQLYNTSRFGDMLLSTAKIIFQTQLDLTHGRNKIGAPQLPSPGLGCGPNKRLG